MKTLSIFFGIVILAGAALYLLRPETVPTEVSEEEPGEELPAITVIAEGLEIPWDIAFLPEGGMLVSERPGRLLLLSDDGRSTVLLSDVGVHKGEGGLLGVAVHPDFDERGWIYLYIFEEGDNGKTVNSVWQYWLLDGELMTPAPIITGIPGAPYHDGGRIEFGPDGLLYITTGDATVSSLAQDLDSLAGKILRIDPRGEIPKDNPFGTAVYSYGHRNPQG